MWTIRYKGHFIHGYCDRQECTVQFPGVDLRKCRTFIGAQRLITHHVRSVNA
jgi:hypothetical protein